MVEDNSAAAPTPTAPGATPPEAATGDTAPAAAANATSNPAGTAAAVAVAQPAAEAAHVASSAPASESSTGATAETNATQSLPGELPFQTPTLSDDAKPEAFGDIAFLDDVELDVKVELGRADIFIEDVLKLGVGSVVELDRLAGDPVDVYVNDRLVARGEVLVLNENFCVRINDIISSVPDLEAGR